jgi:demethylmenaquinone methyltransferase/2-methoxy-6-polyprenyl-1,4-benzoquinol methylase
MSSNEKSVLRVPASDEDVKRSYSLLSRFYGALEELFEKGVRRRALELLAASKGEIILESGIGSGLALAKIAASVEPEGKAYGLDATPEMLRLTGKRLQRAGLDDRVELTQGDVRDMPYSDGMFDAAYMALTLELFDTPDITKVLSEIKRVLKPGGRLITASMSREGHENSAFVRTYEWLHRRFRKYASCRPIYVEQMIREAGFELVKSQEYMIMRLAPIKLVEAKLRRTD